MPAGREWSELNVERKTTTTNKHKNHQPEFCTLRHYPSKANIVPTYNNYILPFNSKHNVMKVPTLQEITVQLWKIVLGEVDFWQDCLCVYKMK